MRSLALLITLPPFECKRSIEKVSPVRVTGPPHWQLRGNRLIINFTQQKMTIQEKQRYLIQVKRKRARIFRDEVLSDIQNYVHVNFLYGNGNASHPTRVQFISETSGEIVMGIEIK